MRSYVNFFLFSFFLVTSNINAQDATTNNNSFKKAWEAGFDTFSKADDLLNKGEKTKALESYKSALTYFESIKDETLESLQQKIITYRIGLCKSRIQALSNSISTGAAVEISKSEPSVAVSTTMDANKIVELEKHRKSLEATLNLYISKYNQEVTNNETLKLDLNSATKAIQKYKNLNMILESKLKELNKQLQENIMSSSKKLADKTKSYESKIAELKADLEKTNKEKEKIRTYVELKEAEFDKLVEKSELQQVEIKNLKGEIATRESSLSEYKKKNLELEKNLAASKDTSAMSREYVESQKVYITKLDTEITKYKEKVKLSDARIRNLEKKLTESSKDSYKILASFNEKVAERNSFEAQVKNLTEEKASLSNQISEMMKENRALSMKQDNLATVTNDKNKEILKLQTMINGKEASINELKKQYLSLQNTLTAFRTDAAKLEGSKASLQQEIAALNSEIGLLRKAVQEKDKELGKKDLEISAIADKKDNAKQAAASATAEKQAMLDKVKEAEAKALLASEGLKAAEFDIKKMAAENAKLENMINANKREYFSVTRESDSLNIEIARIKTELSAKDATIAALKQRIVEIGSKAALKGIPENTTTTIKATTDSESSTSLSGKVYKVKSESKHVTHALVDNNRKVICYLYFKSESGTKYEGKNVQIAGTLKNIPNWKYPLLEVTVAIAE